MSPPAEPLRTTDPATPVRPDYGGAWIGGVVPALLGGAAAGWLPAPVHDARSVVLLVLDGLGWAPIASAPERFPVLSTLDGGPITTVAPSTTGAALTSISTGLPPAQHGIVGFRMRVGGEMLNVLSWQTGKGRKGPTPGSVQPHDPFAGRPAVVVTRSEFRGGGFSDAHLRGARFVGWTTPAVLVEHCRRLVRSGEPFVYAYYDGVDKVAHEFGLRDGFVDVEMAATDRVVGELLAALPPDCALLVTSDHGQVHVEHGAKLGLDEVAPMVTAYGGEGRFRSLHARTGASADLHQAARESYGDRAWVLPRDRLFDEGWLGPGASTTVRGRVGDVVLLAREPVAFIAPDFETEAKLGSLHGSVTPDEMLVPLLAGRGRCAER